MVVKEVCPTVRQPGIQFRTHIADIVCYGIFDIVFLSLAVGLFVNAPFLMEEGVGRFNAVFGYHFFVYVICSCSMFQHFLSRPTPSILRLLLVESVRRAPPVLPLVRAHHQVYSANPALSI